jgi:hypothetical protein
MAKSVGSANKVSFGKKQRVKQKKDMVLKSKNQKDTKDRVDN